MSKQFEGVNFIVTGSISGGRGIEALAVLRGLLALEGFRTRCLVVVWEDEVHTPVFIAMQKLPVEMLVIPPPAINASGNMARQHLSFVSALPFFDADDFIVRIRTDHNCRLQPILALLDNQSDGATGCWDFEHKIFVGAASVLLPGRLDDFNYAGRRRHFDKMMWCENFFSEDYFPAIGWPAKQDVAYFPPEPEMRWAGLYFAMKHPAFMYLYTKYNRFDLPFKFLPVFRKASPVSPASFPDIVKFLIWKMASYYERELYLTRGDVQAPGCLDALFSQHTEIYDLPNLKDMRILGQGALCALAGKAEADAHMAEFVDAAKALDEEDAKIPGTAIEHLERFVGDKITEAPKYYSGPVGGAVSNEASHALQKVAMRVGVDETFSTLRYAKSMLLALRRSSSKEVEALFVQYRVSGGVAGQHVNGFSSFWAVLFCNLVAQARYSDAEGLISDAIGEGAAVSVEQLLKALQLNTTCYVSGEQNVADEETTGDVAHYVLPQNFHQYNLLGDFAYHVTLCHRKVPDNKLLWELHQATQRLKGYHLS